MAGQRRRVLLWTGPKHSGKTTTITELVERVRSYGVSVGGVLAPSVYSGAALIGFEVVDIASGDRVLLAGRNVGGVERTGAFEFTADGLEFGTAVLTSSGTLSAELVIVDEFGPLELAGRGWRQAVDALVRSSAGVILLVVRERLVDQVCQVYARCEPQVLPAEQGDAIKQVMRLTRQDNGPANGKGV